MIKTEEASLSRARVCLVSLTDVCKRKTDEKANKNTLPVNFY